VIDSHGPITCKDLRGFFTESEASSIPALLATMKGKATKGADGRWSIATAHE